MRLHPDIDPQAIRAAFAPERRARLVNVLAPEMAAQLGATLEHDVSYATIIGTRSGPRVLFPDELAAMSPTDRKALSQEMMADAADGIGYHYHGHQIPGSTHPVLKQFEHWLNAPDTLGFIREVTGIADITSADAQATRYVGGHYLTRHLDDPANERRRLAYVFSFTERWHPDWGGLLQFYARNGTPRNAWAPAMNALALFEVSHVHAVTYVTPFAKAPRLSITGWFRAD